MSKFFMLIFCMNCLYFNAFGQNRFVLKGVVVDESNQALSGALVFLHPSGKRSITDDQGHFIINNLSKGNYAINISFIGFNSITDTINISADGSYHAQLTSASQNLQEVVITDNYDETKNKQESLNIEMVNDDYLKQNLGGSLMKSLERLPGISTIDIGSGQSKPVIRGLGFNRVVVVENNIKHEAQQWGDDHGLEIDQYAVDKIEIIKGPASLKYGSDAMGGVIDLSKHKLPIDQTFGGTIDLTGKTNSNYLGTSLSLYGRKKWFFADFRATILDFGDYKVPTDSVDIYSYRVALYNNQMRNTAGKEQNLHFSFGIIKRRFQSKMFLSNVSSKMGFFANAHGLEPRYVDAKLYDASSRDILYPYQQVNHFKITNTMQYSWEKLKIESDFGFQHNFRQELSQYVSHGYMPALFPDTLGFKPELEIQFDKIVYSGNIKFNYTRSDELQFESGLNTNFQINRIDGRAFIIPAFSQFDLGTYFIGKFLFTKNSMVQAGLRYDTGNINTSEYFDWFPSPVVIEGDTILQYLQRAEDINRNFSNFTWSVGYNLNLEKWLFKANIGKSFRMPIAKELAANGVNYHHFSYEVGNSGLSPEISYQLDAGLAFHSKKIAIEATPFLNYFANYIYLNPSSEHDRLYGSGNQVFYYTQSKVFRYGTELHAHYQVLNSLQIGIMGEYVFSEQLSGEKKGFTLPFSPPPSALLNLKYQKQAIKMIKNVYLSVDYRITAPQNHIVPPEETTEGSHLINVGMGGDVILGNQQLSITVQVQNLLNSKYFYHTSYYRLINVPEPGRNFVLNISFPFSGKIK